MNSKSELLKLAARADPRTSHGFDAGMGDRAPMPSVHAHGDLEVNYVFAGATRYFLGGKFVELTDGTFAAFWAAMPHRVVTCSQESEYMWLSVPLPTLLRWEIGDHFLHRALGGEVFLDAGAPGDAAMTRRWIDDLWSGEAFRIRTVELEVEARLHRLLFSSRGTGRPARAKKSLERIESIAAFLDGHYREHISIDDIGRAVGLHPNYAMSIFRRECGLTIWQYLMRRRLAQAQLLLLTSDMPVLGVALESGFGSLPRFYAVFSRECGVSPGDYRRRA
jgi:AraC-like DNA-binding protein